ncbi:MAG: Uma2 family endonuclease [Chloroflexi bacterium]|nr:Uma2 family endonuclease [Chloroflexota bacterium]
MARHRFTFDDYHRMAQAGILNEDDRVELIRGEVIDVPPIGPDHAWSVDALSATFHAQLGARAVVHTQNPVRLPDNSEPEPDVTLLLPPLDRYRGRIPVAADTLLVIEVADTTLGYDRYTKAALYAAAGVPEYWVVNINGRQVEVMHDPQDGEYQQVALHNEDAVLSPRAFPDVTVRVGDILP